MKHIKLSPELKWLLLFLVAFLPIAVLRDYTPDNELRYLSIADEAIRSHRFFAFQYDGVPYADKPPLYIWLVMLTRWIGAGTYQMWVLTLFSLLPMLVVTRVMYSWTAGLLDRRMRLTAALMLATCGYWFALGLTIRMDMMMCMFIVLALEAWWRNYSLHDCQSARLHWLFAIYTFMALFTKGPVGILVPILGVTTFCLAEKKGRLLARSLGWRLWATLLLGCGAWWTAAWIEGGSDYIYNLLFKQTVNRAINADTHTRPFWFYLTAIWYTFAPWMPWLAYIYYKRLREKAWQTEPLARFMMTVALTTFVMLSAFSSKLQVYLLPMAPLLVYAAMIWQRSLGDIAHKVVRGIVAVLLVIVFVGGCAMPWINPKIGYRDLSERMTAVADSLGTERYVSCGLTRFPAIDVFVNQPVRNVPVEDVLNEENASRLLVTKEKDLARHILLDSLATTCPSTRYGDYVLIALPSSPFPTNSPNSSRHY